MASRRTGFPAAAHWHALLWALLALAVLPLFSLAFDLGPDFGRRSLVLHAGIAGVLLPLGLLAALTAGLRGQAWWPDRLLWLLLAGAATTIAALILFGAGKPLLLSYFPLLADTIHPALLIAGVALAALQLLLRPRGLPQRPASDEGIGWLALPLLLGLAVYAWGWIGGAEIAPHVREELVAWGSGHAWLFVLAALTGWGWLLLAEVSGARRVGWTIALALAAIGVLGVLATTPIEHGRYLKLLHLLQLSTLWPVPAALAIGLLRDPVRRAVGGAWLSASMGIFFLTLAGAAWTMFGASTAGRDAARLGPLLLQHGLGLAACVALAGAVHRRSGVATGALGTRGVVFRLGAIGLVGGLILALALNRPPPTENRPPLDPAARQHALASAQREIAERFRQGVQMMQLRQYEHAVTAFHRVLALDPTLPEAHVNIGFALLETGQPAAAQRFFEAATRLNKNQLNAYYGLALAAMAQGAGEVAAGAMRTWLHLAPADDPFRARGEALFDQASAQARRQRAPPPP